MFDLDGHIVGDLRKLAMKRLDQFRRVANAIEKVRVAKRNMLRAGGHLLADVLEHNFAAHNSKDAFVHRHDGAVAAEMFAAAAGFRGADDSIANARDHEVRVLLKRRHPRAVRYFERQTLERT